jgi:DNA-binding beta-propeller fold protein YncE
MPAMRRSALVAMGVLLLAGCAGSRHTTAPTTRSERTTAAAPAAQRHPKAVLTPAQKLGFPALAPGRVPGYVMVADRNNDRIIIVNPRTNRVVWVFPRPGDVKAGQSFHDPDDAFFTPGYKSVSTNEEYNQTIAEVDVHTHRIVWSFGHAGVRGSAYGYLSNPDDAYELPNGLFMVADIQNCRVLFINRAHKVVREIGHAGACGHNPPQGLSSPNGATPLPDGGVLVTEIGGWVDRISKTGRLLWTIRTPTSYPSDAQLLPNGNVLVAGFNTPGRVDEITPHGAIVWTYAPTGYWSLDRPSLAVNWPNGLIAITDDWHHRVVVIDRRTKRVVWSYGHLNQPGTAPGYMNKPDGLDLLPAVATQTPTQPPKIARTSARDTSSQARVQRVGSLPETLSKAAAVALPGGRVMVLGGETGGASTDQILVGTPAHLRRVGTLPAPTHDAAAALLGNSVYLFGGGQATSVDSVVRVDPRTEHAVAAGRIGEPLSDLGAVVVGGKAYLVGGYTGSRYATAVLRYPGAKVVARLPAGTRYAGVAALGGRIYVAGGLTTQGATDAVYEVALPGPVRRVATLPRPLDHAGMAELGGKLYLVGGAEILRLDPSGAVAVVARLPVSLSDPAVVAVAGRLVIVGGGTNAVYTFRP